MDTLCSVAVQELQKEHQVDQNNQEEKVENDDIAMALKNCLQLAPIIIADSTFNGLNGLLKKDLEKLWQQKHQVQPLENSDEQKQDECMINAQKEHAGGYCWKGDREKIAWQYVLNHHQSAWNGKMPMHCMAELAQQYMNYAQRFEQIQEIGENAKRQLSMLNMARSILPGCVLGKDMEWCMQQVASARYKLNWQILDTQNIQEQIAFQCTSSATSRTMAPVSATEINEQRREGTSRLAASALLSKSLKTLRDDIHSIHEARKLLVGTPNLNIKNIRESETKITSKNKDKHHQMQFAVNRSQYHALDSEYNDNDHNTSSSDSIESENGEIGSSEKRHQRCKRKRGNTDCQKFQSRRVSTNNQAQRRRSGGKALPDAARGVLLRWLHDHQEHPYPTPIEQRELARIANLTPLQVNYFCINVRARCLRRGKPLPSMDEDKHEAKDGEIKFPSSTSSLIALPIP